MFTDPNYHLPMSIITLIYSTWTKSKDIKIRQPGPEKRGVKISTNSSIPCRLRKALEGVAGAWEEISRVKAATNLRLFKCVRTRTFSLFVQPAQLSACVRKCEGFPFPSSSASSFLPSLIIYLFESTSGPRHSPRHQEGEKWRRGDGRRVCLGLYCPYGIFLKISGPLQFGRPTCSHRPNRMYALKSNTLHL